MVENQYSIEFDDVVQQFRRITERPDTLREVFAKVRRHRINYQDFEAVKHVSFRISKGEVVGLIGRNGSGKSTILKIVAGDRPRKYSLKRLVVGSHQAPGR